MLPPPLPAQLSVDYWLFPSTGINVQQYHQYTYLGLPDTRQQMHFVLEQLVYKFWHSQYVNFGISAPRHCGRVVQGAVFRLQSQLAQIQILLKSVFFLFIFLYPKQFQFQKPLVCTGGTNQISILHSITFISTVAGGWYSSSAGMELVACSCSHGDGELWHYFLWGTSNHEENCILSGMADNTYQSGQ